MEKVNINNLNKSFTKLKVLKDINLKVKQGQVISIIGPSGSGKSTLLRCMIGLEGIDSGNIKIDGISAVSGSDVYNKMGMVFQNFNLFPHKTVLENVTEGPIVVQKVNKQEAEKRGEKILDRVGLYDKKDCYPARISGGQKQRVAIARALAMNPDILLFDEPTSSLDPELVGEVLKVIEDLARDNITLFIVTHEMGFAREVSDRVVFMDKGEIIADTPPDKMFNIPEKKRIEDFLDKIL